MTNRYDVVVIGGGAAGLTAGLFAARYGLKTVVVERLMSGGQVINAERIENMPGFPQPLAGFDLGPLLQEQATNAGAEFLMDEVTALRLDGDHRLLETAGGQELQASAVIVAGGSTLRRLGLPREEELHGMGVSYCATCDGGFFVDQVVGVIGGGDSALDEALTLTEYASRVVVFHRSNTLSAQQTLQNRVLSHSQVEMRWNTRVTDILGEREVTGVRTEDTLTGETSQVDITGLFIFVGLDPNTGYLKGALPVDNGGHLEVDLRMQTPVPGVFAAGDIRQQSVAQLAAAAGDGATAAISAYRYLRGNSR